MTVERTTGPAATAATDPTPRDSHAAPGPDTPASPLTAAPSDRPLPEQTVVELREIMARYPQARSALLPMLHLVQSSEGCVTSTGIETCAELLGISPAEVSGVATFYTMYKRRPVGDYHVGVCTNTLCAVMGGDEIMSRLSEHLDVGNDETTDDGAITLEHVECNAACDYAPVVMVNWEFVDDQTPESAVELVDALRRGDEVRATRGARICTWRQAERVLAGFPDGRADEGPSAGPASLLGREIARDRGWAAPPMPDREPAEGTATSTPADSTADARGAAGHESAESAEGTVRRADGENRLGDAGVRPAGAPDPGDPSSTHDESDSAKGSDAS